MILRLSSDAQRAALVATSIVLALLLTFFPLRNALATHYAAEQTAESIERATRLEPANAENWYLLGRYWQYNLEEPDAARAIRAYLSALSFNPASADIWLDLATAYESEGNIADARDAFLHAKKAYPLSSEVSWRYANFLLRQGELDSAFVQMRLAVQGDHRLAAEAFSRSLRAGSDVDTAISRILPPDSEAYLDVIWDQTTDRHTANALKVWNQLAALHPHIALNDAFSLVGALMEESRIPEAKRVWDQAVLFAGLADLQSPLGSILWDGGFESGISGGGFTWLFSSVGTDVQVGTDIQEKHSGKHSLRLIFSGKTNVNLTGPCHYVPVRPSTNYLFSAWIKTRGITTDQGVRFQLRSIGIENTSTVVTPDARGTTPWTLIELPWSSGNDVQELQVCVTRSFSDQEKNRIQGTAWVDDVALGPEAEEHPKP
jgi:tetratricopeptide (TPR) repeat protein